MTRLDGKRILETSLEHLLRDQRDFLLAAEASQGSENFVDDGASAASQWRRQSVSRRCVVRGTPRKLPRRARREHRAALWRLFEGRRLRWRCVATRGSTSSALGWWFIGTGF